MKFLFCASVIAAFVFIFVYPSNSETRPPIIDVHLHAFDLTEFGDPPPPNFANGKPSPYAGKMDAFEAVTAEMKKNNIVKAVVSGRLQEVLRWQEKAPDVMIGSAFFSERSPLPAIPELHSYLKSGKLQAIGELGLQYAGLTASDPRFEEYFAVAERLDVPVGIHTGLGAPGSPYTCCPNFRVTLGKPSELEEMLVKHPKLRVYLMHAGYPYINETLAILYMYRHVYVDIAVLNWVIPREEFHNYLRALVRAGMAKRIMFGSDQMVWPEAISMAIEGVESAEFLSEEQKRDIFYNNAMRFFKWE